MRMSISDKAHTIIYRAIIHRAGFSDEDRRRIERAIREEAQKHGVQINVSRIPRK